MIQSWQRMLSLVFLGFPLHVKMNILKKWYRFSLRGNNQLLYPLSLLGSSSVKNHLHKQSTYQRPILQVFVTIPAFAVDQGESRVLTQELSGQNQGPLLPSSGLAHIPPTASISSARCSLTWWGLSGGAPKLPEFPLKCKRKQQKPR